MLDDGWEMHADPTTPPSSAPTSSSFLDSHRKRWSWVWRHTPINRPSKKYFNHLGQPIWKCMYCNKEYRESGGTRIIIHHLKTDHAILEVSPREERRARIRGAI
jgi:hypothetical protein